MLRSRWPLISPFRLQLRALSKKLGLLAQTGRSFTNNIGIHTAVVRGYWHPRAAAQQPVRNSIHRHDCGRSTKQVQMEQLRRFRYMSVAQTFWSSKLTNLGRHWHHVNVMKSRLSLNPSKVYVCRTWSLVFSLLHTTHEPLRWENDTTGLWQSC